MFLVPVEPADDGLPHRKHSFNDAVGKIDAINTVVDHNGGYGGSSPCSKNDIERNDFIRDSQG